MIKFNLIKNWVNKKIFSLCFGVLFLTLFLFLPSPALAFWETIKNAILFLPYAAIALVLVFSISATQAIVWLAGFILDVAMSPSLISLSYTNPATNQVIKAGLNITQSFVNLLLVVVLVYTALSLALRLNETQAKKMLARLIIVALLVNFAPVFCGLIVDAANITMYYFLKPMEDGVSGVLTQIGPHVSRVIHTIWQARVDLTERLGVLMMGITQIIINISMGLAFLLFAAVFLLRYIAIWTLVILAPIAFVAWIFPAGRVRGFWDMWFNQFIQWSIIGIPIAFFLYLAMGSFSLMTAAFQQKITMPGIEAPAIGYFNEVFPYFVVIAFLYLGFILGLQTSAMGAKAIVDATKKGMKASGRAAAGRGWQWTRAGAGAVRQEFGRMRQSVQIQRAVYGETLPRALGTAIRGSWQTRIRPAITRPATYAAAGKGIYSAVKDTAMAGGRAAFGIKRKGTKQCPNCKGKVAASAITCPNPGCGYVF